LDTNIYRHNPKRDNLNFKAIEKLANAGWLKLHIPYVVEREFQTQQREIYSKDLEKMKSGLSGLLKKPLSTDVLTELNHIKVQLDTESENILFDAENQFLEWAESIDANRYPLCLEQANKALEAYFQGLPPLKSPKIRDDIPDSFVVQAIKKLRVENNAHIHIVTDDNKIIDTFDNINIVTVYKDLSKLIESDIIQNELKELDLVDNKEEIRLAIEDYENNYCEISAMLSKNIGEAILGSTITDKSIPDDNNEATINSYYEAEDMEFDFTNLAYYGNGQFGIPFSLKIMVGAYYYIFKGDYYCIENPPSVTDHNDHYLEA
jgi:hypothetical protein